MRKCFIHIGTHKTGTTAIQHLLSRHSSALKPRRYSYPRAGRLEMLPGHHNLAWEISSDHRFSESYGSIEDLIREVENGSADIILSSEDFECSLHHQRRFSDFISLLQSCGFLVTVILYVRNQIDYVPRLYLTLMHSGLDLPFADVLKQVLERAEFRWREWIFSFDYCDLLNRIDAIANVDTIVRSYEQAKTSICSDVLSIFKLGLQDLGVSEEVVVNASLPVRDYFVMFFENRIGRNLLDSEKALINSLISSGTDKIELSPAVRSDLFQRFKESNRKFFIRHDILEPKLEDPMQYCPDKPYIDQLFTENIETYVTGRSDTPMKPGQEGS